MIRFHNVSKVYPRTGAAVSKISFHLRKGEFAFLTGPSGAGKSTVLRLIHSQTQPTEGELQVSRYHTARIKRRQIPNLRRQIGFVFQDFKLLDRLTAEENVAFGLKVTGTSRRDISSKVPRLLDQVGLTDKARSFPSELSAGEKQRVVIARAVATDPLLLLADEPTGNLDPQASEEVFQLFRMLNRQGMAVLMATHDTELVRRNPDVRVLELKHGQLISDSTAQIKPVSTIPEMKDRGLHSAPNPAPDVSSTSGEDPMMEEPRDPSSQISLKSSTAHRKSR